MRYYSDKLKRVFDTEEKLFAAEEAADKEKKEAKAKEAEIKKERNRLLGEVDAAKNEIAKAQEAVSAANKAYIEAVKKLRAFEFKNCSRYGEINVDNYDSVFDFISDFADRLSVLNYRDRY